MANSYFAFKQFTIQQDRCAMKVCTDACLFGSLIAELKNVRHCLDIGTGTGLLPLIFAQKNHNTLIDAVEIETDAASQAKENIAASPWADNIQVHHTDILTFVPEKNYDCIISNPPFFEDDLQSPDAEKNKAKHNTTLNLLQLLKFTGAHLSEEGIFAVLLPYHRLPYFIKEANAVGLYLSRQILVKQTLKHKFFRGILFFTKKENTPIQQEIIIKNIDNNYTPEFSALLKDYYLFL